MYYNIGTFSEQIYQLTIILFCFMYLYICLCVLCIVICMHTFHSAHIFKVCNSVIWPTHSIFNYGHISKLYCHVVYSPLNSYVDIHWILDFKYILLLLLLTNCKSCRTQHWELPHDAHNIQTYNICMTKHSHSPYTITYSSTPHNTSRKHNIHHIPYTNTQHTSTLHG